MTDHVTHVLSQSDVRSAARLFVLYSRSVRPNSPFSFRFWRETAPLRQPHMRQVRWYVRTALAMSRPRNHAHRDTNI